MRRTLPALVALAWIGACTSEPPDPVETAAVRADSVGIAMTMFEPTAFDTITWESPDEALSRGNVVYRISCEKCHGDTGRGNGNFVLEGDTLRPPSFLGPDWRFADDPMGLRREIFTGRVAGMPYWGLVGLKYRDIDAVATYITEWIRP